MRPPSLIVAVVAIVAVFGLGRCHGARDGRSDAILAQAQANAHRVAQAYHASRDSIPVLLAQSRQAEASVQQMSRRVRNTEARLQRVLDNADSVSRDTAVSRDTVQAVLARVSTEARALLAQNAVYRDSVRRLVDAFAAERAGYMSALTLADSTIAAQAAVIEGLTDKASCRILFVKCPSRTQSFLGGTLLATLTLVVLL